MAGKRGRHPWDDVNDSSVARTKAHRPEKLQRANGVKGAKAQRQPLTKVTGFDRVFSSWDILAERYERSAGSGEHRDQRKDAHGQWVMLTWANSDMADRKNRTAGQLMELAMHLIGKHGKGTRVSVSSKDKDLFSIEAFVSLLAK